MKKLLSVLLCLVLVVSCGVLLAGCNSKTGKATLYTNNLVQEVTTEGDIYTVKLNGTHKVDTMILEESTDNVRSFGVYGKESDGSYTLVYKQDRIDKYRVCALDEINTDEIRIEIWDKIDKVKIKNIEVYNSSVNKSEKSFRVVDYLMATDNKLQNNKNNKEFYDHLKVVDDLLMFGSISLNTDTSICYNEGKERFINDIEIIKNMKKLANNEDMKIVVSIDIQSKIVEGVEAKKQNKTLQKWLKENNKKDSKKFTNTLIPNIVSFVEEHNIDGIEFDWDYPENGTQWDYYSKLIVELKNRLPEGKFITVGAYPSGAKFSKKARNAIEYVNLKSYDMFDERGEHASNYETCKHSVETFVKNSKFSTDKIMLGLPFYGRPTSGANEFVDMNWYYTNSGGKTDKWLNKIYNYKYYDDKGFEKYSDVYINSYAMIRDKTTYAIASGLGGVSIYKMASDTSATYEYSLHKAVGEAVNRGVSK